MLNDGMASSNTATMTLVINETEVGVGPGTLYLSTESGSDPCAACDPMEVSGFYAITNGHSEDPYVESGELRIFGDDTTGNKVYTNAGLTTLASAGHYLYQTSATSPDWICVEINASGVVISEANQDECERES